MNKVVLIGRLTKEPELKYAAGTGTAVVTFTLAVNRRPTKEGTKEADFIRMKAFNKTAETIANYVSKGHQLAIVGRIQTGSYDDKNGNKVYTTDVIVDEMDFLEKKGESQSNTGFNPDEYATLDDGEIPF